VVGKRRHALPLIIDVTYAVACQSFEVGLLEKVGIADLHSEVPLIGWKLGKKRIQIVDKVPSVFVIPRVKVRELEYDADLFLQSFLRPLQSHREKTGLIIFQFSHFYSRDYEYGRDFVDDLDSFLSKLPTDEWDFGVEIRNSNFLKKPYFETLARHGVGHVYNQWQRMPSLPHHSNTKFGILMADNYISVDQWNMSSLRSHRVPTEKHLL
jgi:hypothetical protein